MDALTFAFGIASIAAAYCNSPWLCCALAVAAVLSWRDNRETEREVDAIEAELAEVDNEFRRAA